MKPSEENVAGLSPLQKAFYKLETYKARVQQLEAQNASFTDIAIIGMALRFPQADEPEQFWQNLVNKRDHVGPLPDLRKNELRPYLAHRGRDAGDIHYLEGAYLDDLQRFDYEFFKLKPREAAALHPLQRLFLEVSWRALEDAGYLNGKLKDQKAGVYLGAAGELTYAQYLDMVGESTLGMNPAALTGNIASITSSRISYFLDLKGPAITIDTACSSSLVAIHQACKALANGDCEVAIAGGGRVFLLPEAGKYQMGFESPKGRSRPFDAQSDGAGMGEGVAAIVLKPLKKALADGDAVYAVIKGSAVNQDGTSAGITAPNLQAQVEVLRAAWQSAGIDPASLGYIEAHGTGTPLGDPIEFQALKEAFGVNVPAQAFCALGAVKSNLGHLYEAAGIAGLIKCVLALKNQQIPATIHHDSPNREIDFARSPFFLNNETIDWQPKAGLRRCGVSSFGISGTNAHVVLEEYLPPVVPATNSHHPSTPQLFVLSAESKPDLLQFLHSYRGWLDAHPDEPLERICYSSNSTQGNYGWRFAQVVDSREALRSALDQAENLVQCSSRKFEVNGQLSKKKYPTDNGSEARLRDAAALFQEGGTIDWKTFYEDQIIQRIALPAYPLKSLRCQLEFEALPTASLAPAVQPMTALTHSREELYRKLRLMIAKDTELSVDQIPETGDFFQLGLDSLIIIQLIQGIQKEFGVKLEMGHFYEKLSTLKKLTDHLIGTLEQKVLPTPLTPTWRPLPTRPNPENRVRAVPQSINYFVPYKEINHQAETHLSERQQQHLAALTQRINARTVRTKNSTQAYRQVLATNRNVAGFRPETKEITYQIIAERAQGARITDLDGNEYVDLTMGFGVNLLGYNPDFIQQALLEAFEKGFPVGPMIEDAGKVAALIRDLTGVERVAFYNSGSEAVMIALRLARTVTGRSKFVLFKGSYHGTFDGVLALGNALDPMHSIPLAPGISDNYISNAIVLDYGTDESLALIREHAHELAAVLVEPVQSRRPDLQPRAFLHELRKITEQAGAAMILDEVITGFRILPGGAQAWLGLKADLVTYGKIVGGGMPIGVVAGTSAFMDAVDGGMWQFGDDTYPGKPTTFVAGTFNQHPLAMSASLAMLRYLMEQGSQLQERLNAKTQALSERLNQYFTQHHIPIKVHAFGSLFRFFLKGNWDLFYQHLLANGVYVWEGRNCFLSTAHTDDDIDFIYEAAVRSVEEMLAGGWVMAETVAPLLGVRLSEEQEKLYALALSNPSASSAFNENQVMDLEGALDRSALEKAIVQVVNRHQALRTVAVTNGQLLVAEKVQPIIEILTAESLHRSKSTAQTLSQLVAEKGTAPFDLSKGPLIRFALVEISPTHHQLLMTTHHLVADGWSIEVIWSELSQVYSALVSGELPALATPTPIEAFNNWQKAAFTSEEESDRQIYWQREFARNYPSLQLPADRLHAVAATKVGQSFSMPIPDALKQQLVQLAQQEKTTLFNVLLAGYTILLYRLSNQETFVLGIPASGQVQMGKSCLVGQCVNMLPFYSRVEPERSVTDYLLHIRTRMAEIIRHQTCSFDRVLQNESQLAPPRIATEIDMNSVKNQFRFKGLTNRISFPSAAYVKYDLSVSLIEMNVQLSADFYFNTALFEQATVENWAQSYLCLLQDMAENPLKSLLHLQLAKEEAADIFSTWNNL